MDTNEIILNEFDPVAEGTFLNTLLYDDTFELYLYNRFREAINEKFECDIDVVLQQELLKKIASVIQYIKLLSEIVIKQLAGLLETSIMGIEDSKLAELCVGLTSDIFWLMDKYIQLT